MFACVLVLAFTTAGPQEPTPHVAVLPVRSESDMPARDAEALRASSAEGVVPAPQRELAGRAGDAISACTLPRCSERTARAHGVAYWLGTHISGADRVYEIDLALWSVTEGRVVARAHERCSICGLADLRARVAESSARLGKWLERRESAAARLAVVAPPDVDGEHTPAERAEELGPPPTAERKPRNPMRTWGIATVAVGSAATIGGAVMLALDGREMNGRCRDPGPEDLDQRGRCRHVHDTLAGGVVATLAGVGLSAAGITLLTLEHRSRKGRPLARLGLMLSPRRVGVQGRF